MASVQIVVRGGSVAAQSPHFHFERVRDATRALVAAKRAPTPLGRKGDLGGKAVRFGIVESHHGN